MSKFSFRSLSRREREIMDILYAKGEASVSETLDAMESPPGYSAVRAMLRLLDEKGVIRHKQVGKKYVFTPVVKKETACHSALRNLLATFFNNSVEQTITSLLEVEQGQLTDEDLDRLASIIESKRTKGE
ncbi:MAG TPA: BlaI/MecI/CopY family transcriptional regulator [Candidatus Sumerlaeota bacterium]|nr:BlaI/MecI/CopY family transcriptional regulator [Candidatus Sumerlaeota bacterium]HPS02045.1 BlaI/MecI/CopY family transcriptional regulator [Candidatus Sumerlaeota bacterium]